MKKSQRIVKFPKSKKNWISSHLYTVIPPKGCFYVFRLNFEDYYEAIKSFYKAPWHFNSKAEWFFSSLFRKNLDKIIWDARTGYPDIESSSSSLYIDFSYSDIDNYSPVTIKKILFILEHLSVLKVLSRGSKSASIELYLPKYNEFLRRGDEKHQKILEAYGR